MSGTFSMGEPINDSQSATAKDSAIEADLSDVISGLKQTTVDGDYPAVKTQRRPGNAEESDQAAEPKEESEFNPTHCLFCNSTSADLKENTLHMGKTHGMFIPEREYLVDLEGLIKYLHAKTTQNNECLYCHKLTSTTAGIQTHMRDKGHCMIAFESEDEMIEIGQFYDFTSTYSDNEAESGETAESGGQDGWETESSASDDSDDLDNNANSAFVNDYELHLPSGRTAGHRSLAKYFRQNLRNYPTLEERQTRQRAIEAGEIDEEEVGTRGRADHRNRALVTRANGGLGMVGVSDDVKRAALKSEKREKAREHRAQRNYQWGINRRANHQEHFRVSHYHPVAVLLNFVRLTITTGSSPTVVGQCLSHAVMNMILNDLVSWEYNLKGASGHGGFCFIYLLLFTLHVHISWGIRIMHWVYQTEHTRLNQYINSDSSTMLTSQE